MDILTVILLILTGTIAVVWSLPFIFLVYFKIQLFNIKDRQAIAIIKKNIKYSSIVVDDDKPSGFFYGWKFIGFINESTDSHDKSEIIWLLTTKIIKEQISEKQTEKNNDGEKNKTISSYERTGNFWWLNYVERKIDIDVYDPYDSQKVIIDDIVKNYKKSKNKCIVAFISGPPGTGKSMISILIAKDLDGKLCDTFDPTDPGDTLAAMYHSISPDDDHPLVLTFDEVDITINKVNDGVEPHKNIPIQVRNKTTWNQLFDKISRGEYQNLIVIMTSNKSIETINTIDPSYLRDGRVNMFHTLA